MPFCSSCGSPVDSRFCPKCGAVVNAAAEAGTTGAPPQTSARAGLTDNVASALCYVFIGGVLFLVLPPYNQNPKIRFHAYQSIFMLGAAIIVWFVLGSLSLFFGSFFRLLGHLFDLIMPLFLVGCCALWIVMMIKAYQDEKIILPVIGPLAEQQV